MVTEFEGFSHLHPQTLAIRSGRQISEFNEHSPALFLSSSFTTTINPLYIGGQLKTKMTKKQKKQWVIF